MIYGKELPGNQNDNTAAEDMTGNVLLMHLNEASGTILDTSGEGNDGTTGGGVVYGVTGRFNSALHFDGTDDVVVVSSAIANDNPELLEIMRALGYVQ